MVKRSVNYKELEKRIGHKFKNRSYIASAITHSSYANETKDRRQSNERLEFLGDSVLGLIVSDYIFSNYPSLPEGQLTKLRSSLVCEKALHEFSKSINLGEFLIMSRGERASGGHELPSILADAFEAVVAAVYLDGGINVARNFVFRFILPQMEKPTIQTYNDYKTILQEMIQRKPCEKLDYEMVGQEGPDHAKRFWAQVKLNEQIVGKGEGKSKKEAQQCAAKEAIDTIKNLKEF
ncbi:MAG: ribonuclease III [Oscillospiraceae bacterium]|jgi:ribonuclease-3|nr:ribonuclease III [Oscillospiraceae bacterium]